MRSGISFLTLVMLLLPGLGSFAQTDDAPKAPVIKSYKGVPGKVTKFNNFNYLDILDEAGKNNRQAMGQFWEISFVYDSAFRQKKKFHDFIQAQIVESKGSIFFRDTLQFHFVIPTDTGNVWGRAVFENDKLYRLRLIREVPFVNKIVFDTRPNIIFDKYVDSVPLPPRINYMPHSVVTRITASKYDHQEFTWNLKDTLFRQKVMGPFWEVKIDVRNARNQVDKHVSTVEILESYYRACTKAGGRIIKSRPRELLFTLPLDKKTMWARLTVSLDGVYFVRVVVEADQDKSTPEKMVTVPNPADSTRVKTDGK